MADKEAKLRLEIEPMFQGTARGAISQLRGQLRGLAGEARGLGQSFASNFAKEVKGAPGGALSSLAGQARGAAGTVLGLAGAYGMMDMAKRTAETEDQFRKLSSSIRFGTGQVIGWRDIQRQASNATKDWAHQTSSVASAMQTLQDASGDFGFVSEQIDNVAIASRASREPIEAMAGLAGDLNEKFGIAGESMQGSLATVLSMANKGGLTFEDLSGSLSKIGASAKLAGLEGEEGLKRILAVANIAEGETGNLKQAVSGVGSLVEGIATGAFQKQGMKAGIDIEGRLKKGASFEDVITEMIVKTKGNTKALGDIVGEGPQLKVMNALSKVFTDAASGPGGVKDGTAALKAALEDAGKSAINWSDVVAQASDNMQSKQAKFDRAMTRLEESFKSDAVSSALDKLADAVPKISSLLGGGIEYIAENPGRAAALYGGAKFGLGAAEGAGAAAGKTLLERYGPGGLAMGGAKFAGLASMPFLLKGDSEQFDVPQQYADAVDKAMLALEKDPYADVDRGAIDEGFTDADGTFRRYDLDQKKWVRTKRMKQLGMSEDAGTKMAMANGMSELDASLIGIADEPLLGGLQQMAFRHKKDLAGPAKPTSGGGGMNAEQKALYDAMMRAGDKLDGTLQVKVIGTVTTYSPAMTGDGGDK